MSYQTWRRILAAARELLLRVRMVFYTPWLTGSYCMVRTQSAGVFAGIVSSRDGEEVVLTDARRIWYWKGAASLSQLATDGTSRPTECKFPAPVPEVLLRGVIEIIPITDKARISISKVKEWRE